MPTRMTVVDLSHLIEEGMTTYPGLPGPELSDHMSRVDSRSQYPAGTEFHIGRISMVANTGTYLDTAFHRYPDGPDLAATSLDALVDVPGVFLDLADLGRRDVRAVDLEGLDVAGHALLVRTGWDRHWRTDTYADRAHPFLASDAVDWLVAQEVALVGIDSVNIDDMADRTRPAHTGLLAAGIPILEHLTALDRLPARGFRVHAAPPPVRGMGSFPVRVYAVLDPRP